EMVARATADVVAQATNDNPDAVELIKRYPKTNARDFDGNPTRITEADALIAYLQMLGTQVDFKLYDDKANIRSTSWIRPIEPWNNSPRPGASHISSSCSR